jgi:hypothetical protein
VASTTTSPAAAGLRGYAAKALADGLVSIDELHEAQQLTVDCLRARGVEAEYRQDFTLRVVHPPEWTQDQIDRVVDDCQESAGGPVIGAYLAQEGPPEEEVREQLIACLQGKRLIGPDPTPEQMDEALDTPEGIACLPGL